MALDWQRDGPGGRDDCLESDRLYIEEREGRHEETGICGKEKCLYGSTSRESGLLDVICQIWMDVSKVSHEQNVKNG